MVRLTGAARKRFVMLTWAATIMIVAAIAFMGFVDPVSVHALVDRATPGMWNSYNLQNQILIVVIGMLLISVVPLLALLFVAAQFSLRDVAYYSVLIRADKPKP